jgi:hypothetical protein
MCPSLQVLLKFTLIHIHCGIRWWIPTLVTWQENPFSEEYVNICSLIDGIMVIQGIKHSV